MSSEPHIPGWHLEAMSQSSDLLSSLRSFCSVARTAAWKEVHLTLHSNTAPNSGPFSVREVLRKL